MKTIKKIHLKIIELFYKINIWFLVSRNGDDYYIHINGNVYYLKKQYDVTNMTLENYFKENKDYLRPYFSKNEIIGLFKYINYPSKSQFIIIFTKDGLYDLFITDPINGLRECDRQERLLQQGLKSKLGESFTNNFYILERI